MRSELRSRLTSAILVVAASLATVSLGSARGAGAVTPWPEGAVIVGGNTVLAFAVPPLLYPPNGTDSIDGMRVELGFLGVVTGPGDVFVYDIAADHYAIADPATLSAITSGEVFAYRGALGMPVYGWSGTLQEFVATMGNIALVGFPLNDFTSGGGGTCTGTNTDADSKPDACDNCPTVANSNQADANGDGLGDACEASVPWIAANTAPTSWSVSRSGNEYVFAGPTPLFTNACEAARSLGGIPVIVVDTTSFVVAIQIRGPPPTSCSTVSDPVAGVSGVIGILPEGQWTFRFQALGVSAPFLVPEPALVWLQLAALVLLSLLARTRSAASVLDG